MLEIMPEKIIEEVGKLFRGVEKKKEGLRNERDLYNERTKKLMTYNLI